MEPASAAVAMAALIGLFPVDVRLTYPEWKYKALTFSYDDAVLSDRRLVEIFNRYGMKATFNVSSGRLGYGNFLLRGEIAALYAGHEIASHGKNHRDMTELPPAELETEIADDLSALSRIAGVPVRGFAYPYAHFSPAAVAALKKNRVCYARICTPTHDFRLPDDFLLWRPTAHHRHDLDAIAERYRNYKPWGGVVSLCYIWGHSYEFNRDGNWQVIEDFCRKLSGDPGIWHATNLEICRYLTAFRNLTGAMDSSRLRNNSAETLYFTVNGAKVRLAPGETMRYDPAGKAIVLPAAPAQTPVPVVPPADGMVFYPDGSRKALAFSYDDGRPEDERLAGLLSRYGCRGTFHLSGRVLAAHPGRAAWYRGHEIASHGLRHATATLTLREQLVNDIVIDRKVLETLSGAIVDGHAWPNGSTFGAPSYAQEALRTAGIAYARGTSGTNSFALPDHFLRWEPTAKAVPDKLAELAGRFAAESNEGELKLCLLWGHSWEYRQERDWQAVEDFCKAMAREKIWRAGMGEICRYLKAVNALEWADHRTMVRNNSGEIVYLGKGGGLYALKPGETVTFTRAD